MFWVFGYSDRANTKRIVQDESTCTARKCTLVARLAGVGAATTCGGVPSIGQITVDLVFPFWVRLSPSWEQPVRRSIRPPSCLAARGGVSWLAARSRRRSVLPGELVRHAAAPSAQFSASSNS